MASPGTEAARETMLAAMNALSTKIIATTALADDLGQAAATAASRSLAAAMLDHARRHRIEALELQGRLAALSTAYAHRFRADP